MKDRIREIRKYFKLTQTVFGERLGISRDSVNNLELGRVEPTEIVVRAIVREFNIDYGWLKDGQGEMFTSEDEEMMTAVDALMTSKNEFAKAILRALSQFDDDQWEALEGMMSVIEKELGR